jgi:hypothetical protein
MDREEAVERLRYLTDEISRTLVEYRDSNDLANVRTTVIISYGGQTVEQIRTLESNPTPLFVAQLEKEANCEADSSPD